MSAATRRDELRRADEAARRLAQVEFAREDRLDDVLAALFADEEANPRVRRVEAAEQRRQQIKHKPRVTEVARQHGVIDAHAAIRITAEKQEVPDNNRNTEQRQARAATDGAP